MGNVGYVSTRFGRCCILKTSSRVVTSFYCYGGMLAHNVGYVGPMLGGVPPLHLFNAMTMHPRVFQCQATVKPTVKDALSQACTAMLAHDVGSLSESVTNWHIVIASTTTTTIIIEL